MSAETVTGFPIRINTRGRTGAGETTMNEQTFAGLIGGIDWSYYEQ